MAMAAPMEGLPQPPPAPATDLTSISFRDQLWLNTYPLDRTLVFDYFAMSPFYDYTCSNEQLRCRGIHPLDMSHLSKMAGVEYVLHDAQEPNLFVFRKQRRDTPDKVTTLAAYYVLDGSIYQAPLLFNVIGSRVVRSLYHISKAFAQAASKLEKIGYDGDVDNSGVEKVSTDEGKKLNEKLVDVKEVMRIDQILGNVLRKLPPAPPPPPLPLPPGGVPEQPIEASQAETASTDQTTLGKQGMGDQGPQLKKAKTEK